MSIVLLENADKVLLENGAERLALSDATAWIPDKVPFSAGVLTVGSAGTIAMVTNQQVTQGTWIFIGVGWWTNTGVKISSVTDNGATPLTYRHHADHVSGNNRAAILRAYAPVGLNSGRTITVTFTGACFQRALMGASFKGESGAPVRATAKAGATTAAHSTSLTSVAAGDLLLEMSSYNGVSTGNTPDANTIEIGEKSDPSGPCSAAFSYRVAMNSGTNTVGGTWGTGGGDWVSASAAFTPQPAKNYREAVLRDAPYAYLPMEEASGSLAEDETVWDRDGTYNSVTLDVAGAV